MRVLRQWIMTFMCALAVLAGGATVLSQDGQAEKPRKPRTNVIVESGGVVVTTAVQEERLRLPAPDVAFSPAEGDTFMFVSSEMSFGGKVVKGAPYSAQALTESAQALADGNRILRKSTATVYRDSEGRTRRDQTLNAIGPYASASDPPQTSIINDPVSGVNYILEPRSRTARKLTLPRTFERVIEGPTPPPSAMRKRKERVLADNVFVAATPAPMGGDQVFHYSGRAFEPKTEALGKQVIEGIEAEGTRSTITIPAGEIGNELPINIVSEQWHSAELQTIILRSHKDPRFGETTYRLTNINRAEPARALFEVPSDYTIKETIPSSVRMSIEKELQREKEKEKQ